MSRLKPRPTNNYPHMNMNVAQSIPAPTSRMLLALVLGLTAAAANILGGMAILHREWSRQYLKYFLALGAGHAGGIDS